MDNEQPKACGVSPQGNLNPSGISLLRLIREDLRTHRNDPLCQGFWALAVHRLANWGKDWRIAPLRRFWRFLSLLAARFVEWTCGITIMDTTRVGRKVRIWHHSGIVLNAASIGDRVVIRQNTTMGNITAGSLDRPIIEDDVEIGCGVAILGGVTVGRGSVIGANAVVTRDIPPGSVAVGVPARVIQSINSGVEAAAVEDHAAR